MLECGYLLLNGHISVEKPSLAYICKIDKKYKEKVKGPIP